MPKKTRPAKRNPDICRNRHRGNAQSEAANKKVDKSKGKYLVLKYLTKVGAKGGTTDEACAFYGKQSNELSGRFTELKEQERIIETGERRKTRTGSMAAVCIINPDWVE